MRARCPAEIGGGLDVRQRAGHQRDSFAGQAGIGEAHFDQLDRRSLQCRLDRAHDRRRGLGLQISSEPLALRRVPNTASKSAG